jgi:hypothetical protein
MNSRRFMPGMGISAAGYHETTSGFLGADRIRSEIGFGRRPRCALALNVRKRRSQSAVNITVARLPTARNGYKGELKRLPHSRLSDAFAKFFHHLLHRALSRQGDVSPGNRWKQRYQKNPDRKDDAKYFNSPHSLVGGEQNEKPKCYKERCGYEAEKETHGVISLVI